MYIKGCYKYGHFKECIAACEKYLQMLGDHKDAEVVKLCKAKSLFSVFWRQAFQMQLFEEKQIKSGKQYHLTRKQCFDNAGRSIELLTSALDGALIDEEGLRMLDLAMIHYSRETNKLNEFDRCLLCRKKAKLRRSHVFPRNILERFCKGMSRPENKRNITPMRYGPLQSPRGLTTFMFCGNCEDLLSRNGEMQFSPMFLDKLYDVKSPESPSSEHHIQYGKWLYQFCIGLLFRVLAQFYPRNYHNDSDIYRFFTQCREYLLSADVDKLPDIAVLVNPNVAPDGRNKLGFMNYALNYPLEQCSSALPLDGIAQKTPEGISYILVHFGIINVIGIIDPGQKAHLPSSSFVQETGGILHVPDNNGRSQVIPRGLWMYFEQTAVAVETEHVQMSLSRLKWQEDNVLTEPPEELESIYGFVPSFQRDIKDQESTVCPATIADIEKTLNFLPEGFQLHHHRDRSNVIIPANHKLILHHTITREKGSGTSLFLAVGTEGTFTPDKPYVIFHSYRPGLKVHAAFFLNATTFQAEEFLPDADPKIRIKDVKCISRIREDIPKLFPDILLSNGVYNLKSLLRRVQMR